MQFQNPWFLLSLIFLTIPIIVHLFNFRKYQKVYFTNIKLIKELLQDTQKASELKKKLILASRLLVVLFIILAFVQPYFSNQNNLQSGKNIVSIYIDNSMSMGAYQEQKTVLDIAKNYGKDIVNQYGNRAQYHILTNDFLNSRLEPISFQDAINEISKITISPKSKKLSEVFEKQKKLLLNENAEQSKLFWISDFQKNQLQSFQTKPYSVEAIQIENTKIENDYIDSIWLNANIYKIGEDAQIVVKTVRQNKENPSKLGIDFKLNNKIKSSKEVSFDADFRLDTFSFKILNNGWNDISIEIKDPSIIEDNTYFLSFYVSPKPKVSIINGNYISKYLDYAFLTDQNFEISNISFNGINPSVIQNTSLLVLNQIQDFTNNDIQKMNEILKVGKNIAIFLPPDLDIYRYNTFLKNIGAATIIEKSNLSTNIKNINIQDPLLKDIFTKLENNLDLPKVDLYYTLQKNATLRSDVLLSLENGYAFLVKYHQTGAGNIFVFTSPPNSEYNRFVNSSLFAPIMFKIGNFSQNYYHNAYLINDNTNIQLPITPSFKDRIFYLRGNEMELIPPQRQIGNILNCSLGNEIQKDGFYILEDAKKENQFHLALNYDRKESQLIYAAASELKNMYQDIQVKTETGKYKSEILNQSDFEPSKWMAIFALLFIFIEILLIIFFDQIIKKSGK